MNSEALVIPPNAIDAEQAVLGGLMLRNEALAEVADWLSDSDFYRRDHQLIYRALLDLAAQSKPFDAVTLAEAFADQGIAEMVGGTRYVMELANNTPSAANILAYAEIVREKSRLRQAMTVAHDLAQDALHPGRGSATDVVGKAQQALMNLAGDPRVGGLVTAKSVVKDWFAGLNARYEANEEITGLATPWAHVTETLLGFQPGELVILAGRPNMGKSVAGFQCAGYAATGGQRTAMFSIEMRRQQFVQRQVACLGHIPYRGLQRPRELEEEHWPRVSAATKMLIEAPLLVDDQAGITVQQIVARSHREHLRAPLKFIVIDHLHEIRRANKDPVNELGEIARSLKQLAKDLNVPVLLLAQLNRANAQRTGDAKRPTLTDLRASGAVEEVADVILFLHREDYYDRKTHLQDVVELIIGKGRELPAGETLYLRNHFDQMRLEQWIGELPFAPQREPAQRKRGFGASNSGKDRAAA